MSKSETNPLRLRVSNFGPIVKADVELRPLTVFIGPSNTGKSYLAILIYALHRVLSDYAGSAELIPVSCGFMGRYGLGRNLTKSLPKPKISTQQVDLVLAWLQQPASQSSKNKSSTGYRLPDEIETLVAPRLLQLVGIFQDDLDGELKRCFGLGDTQQLVRRPDPGAKEIEIILNGGNADRPMEYRFKTGQSRSQKPSIIPENQPLSIMGDLSDFMPWEYYFDRSRAGKSIFRKRTAIEALTRIAMNAFIHNVSYATQPIYYLPAARTGLMHAHQVVVSALIDSATSAGIRRASPLPILSGVLADFLDQLIALSDVRERSSRIEFVMRDSRIGETLAKDLEQQVLMGSVHDERKPESGGYPAFSYLPKGWDQSLSLMHASSMVSELTPVVLYLRHVVRKGEILIIEEPESNLHPAMQVAFIRQLAKAVHAGIHIIVTTHSEWILEELANLVRASDIPEAKRAGLQSAELALKPEQVGAWLFSSGQSSEGSEVKEIRLDVESGLYPSGFDEVAMALHNEWADVSSLAGKE